MAPETLHLIATLTSLINNTEMDLPVTPIISAYVFKVIEYFNAYVLGILVGVVVGFINIANICVYLKMGHSETTNINFFALSIFDLLAFVCAVIVQITYNRTVSVMKLPSGVPVSEFGIAVCHKLLCISTPLKVRIFIYAFFFKEV